MSKKGPEAMHRIYATDTTQLQREERERQELLQELRALESQLRTAVASYEESYRASFLWRGQSLMETLAAGRVRLVVVVVVVRCFCLCVAWSSGADVYVWRVDGWSRTRLCRRHDEASRLREEFLVQ